jgi:Wall-associated receptor kinase galacturonan-binding
MKTTELLLATLLALAYPSATIATKQPKCPSSCGDLAIPYPFGIGTGCFRDGFEITCNMSDNPNRKYVATLAGTTVPLLNISLEVAEVRVQLPVGWQCYNESGIKAYFMAEVDFKQKGVYR